jgi:3-oxoacyl-[acyl-carrier protein] reductase
MENNSTKIALVTGAARGIGKAIVMEFLNNGYRVIAIDRNAMDDDVLKAAFPDTLWCKELDITHAAAIQALPAEINSRWGHVSVLVNNAGISPKQADGYSAKILDTTDAEWDAVIAVNMTAVLHMAQAFLPGMKQSGWGRVINLSSLAGRTKSISAGISYMATKAAILGITRSIAAEMGPFGITANAVAPGRVVTEMSMTAGAEANQKIADSLPVRRLGEVAEIAKAVTYLSSDAAGFVNGAVIDINGGIFMS